MVEQLTRLTDGDAASMDGRRLCLSGEKQKEEVRYCISSLHADAASYNKYIRTHWGIENHLHQALDVVFHEDQSLKKAGHAPENFALVSRIALNLLQADTDSKISMKNKRRKAGWDNNYLMELPIKGKIKTRLPW